jgi:hypothetical protein
MEMEAAETPGAIASALQLLQAHVYTLRLLVHNSTDCGNVEMLETVDSVCTSVNKLRQECKHKLVRIAEHAARVLSA